MNNKKIGFWPQDTYFSHAYTVIYGLEGLFWSKDHKHCKVCTKLKKRRMFFYLYVIVTWRKSALRSVDWGKNQHFFFCFFLNILKSQRNYPFFKNETLTTKPEIQLNYKWATKGEFYVVYMVFSLRFFQEFQTFREVKS